MFLPFAGHQPRVHSTAFVAPGAVLVGDVEVGEDASIWFCTVVRGDVHHIRIGARTNVQDGSVLHVTTDTHPLHIEEGVTIGHGAVIHGCTLRHHVLVGMHATVLDGADIGAESILGAGCLVTSGKTIPPRSLVMGTPGTVVRTLTDEEVRRLHLSADHYVEIARHYRDNIPAAL